MIYEKATDGRTKIGEDQSNPPRYSFNNGLIFLINDLYFAYIYMPWLYIIC